MKISEGTVNVLIIYVLFNIFLLILQSSMVINLFKTIYLAVLSTWILILLLLVIKFKL